MIQWISILFYQWAFIKQQYSSGSYTYGDLSVGEIPGSGIVHEAYVHLKH